MSNFELEFPAEIAAITLKARNMIRPFSIMIFTLCLFYFSSLIGAYNDDDSSEPVARLLVYKVSRFKASFFVLFLFDSIFLPTITLLYKSSKTNPVVEGQNFQILYQIINNGDGIARKIEVTSFTVYYILLSLINTVSFMYCFLSNVNRLMIAMT